MLGATARAAAALSATEEAVTNKALRIIPKRQSTVVKANGKAKLPIALDNSHALCVMDGTAKCNRFI